MHMLIVGRSKSFVSIMIVYCVHVTTYCVSPYLDLLYCETSKQKVNVTSNKRISHCRIIRYILIPQIIFI